MEEMLVQSAAERPVMVFRPSKSLFSTEAPATENPRSVHGEPIEVAFNLENTIKPAVLFENINLLWEFRRETGEIFSNRPLFLGDVSLEERSEIENVVASSFVALVTFGEHETKTLVLKLTPRSTGQLRILGIVGKISAAQPAGSGEAPSLWGKQLFEAQPIRVGSAGGKDGNKPVAAAAASAVAAFDRKLEIEILPPAPALHVSFSHAPSEVLAGEVIPLKMNMTNAGVSVLNDIYVCIDNPRYVLLNPSEADIPLSIRRDLQNLANENVGRDREARKQYVCRAFREADGNFIAPNETKTGPRVYPASAVLVDRRLEHRSEPDRDRQPADEKDTDDAEHYAAPAAEVVRFRCAQLLRYAARRMLWGYWKVC